MRSVLGREPYSVADGVDLTVVLCRDLNATPSPDVPVEVLTGSLSQFNVMIRTSSITREKRLMTYIAAMREAYDAREI